MENCASRESTEARKVKVNHTAAQKLRKAILSQLSEVLQLANTMDDSLIRLKLQAHCLDVAVDVEQVIEDFALHELVQK